jgi:hypothetical protein
MNQRNFQMTEISRRNESNSRRETEMQRVEAIRKEMSSGVRLLGASGRNADEENAIAARLSGLSVTVIERIRWKKIKRIPADITDVIREAIDAYNTNKEARARHERDILATQLASFLSLTDQSSDPEFYRARAAHVVDQARRAGVPNCSMAEEGDAR